MRVTGVSSDTGSAVDGDGRGRASIVDRGPRWPAGDCRQTLLVEVRRGNLGVCAAQVVCKVKLLGAKVRRGHARTGRTFFLNMLRKWV